VQAVASLMHCQMQPLIKAPCRKCSTSLDNISEKVIDSECACVLQSKPFFKSPTSEKVASEGLGGLQGEASELYIMGFDDATASACPRASASTSCCSTQ
jgi:hypothetical protein